MKNKKKQKNEEIEVKQKSFKIKLVIFIIILLVIFVIFYSIFLGIYISNFKSMTNEMISYHTSSIVYDTDGNEIAKLGSGRITSNIDSSNIPSNLKNAYISIEDQRFYSRNGVDIKRTSGAIWSYIKKFGKASFGGSTITQQLVKNLTGDDSKNISRKVKEWTLALSLESTMSKDEILTAYLNNIYVGPNMYGVENAAKYYFNKPISDLSLAECAYIAGINHSPNSYLPFSDKDNSDKIKSRSKTVLMKMLELGYISQEEYDNSLAEINNGLKFKKGEITPRRYKRILISYRCSF